MNFLTSLFCLLLLLGQTGDAPAYLREGDRVEQHFRDYHDKLERFVKDLRGNAQTETHSAPPELSETPPQPAVYGYRMVPQLVTDMTAPAGKSVGSFMYSWPITDSYIDGEEIKLSQAKADLDGLAALEGGSKDQAIAKLTGKYRELLNDQKTIDQYIQYNRFWQRAIAADRPRYDQLTKIYHLIQQHDEEMNNLIREVLGTPDVPAFVRVERRAPAQTVLHVPVYTDIDDEGFLTKAKNVIETAWHASGTATEFSIEIEFRYISRDQLYRDSGAPAPGSHFDMQAHAARFPVDGAILTTGAESTHSFVGRYIALGPGALSERTLAHEFGHILGFSDGYVRGYRDLGDKGFEIMEITSVFDDIMSAPREGHVLPAHFELMLASIAAKN